MLLHSSGRYIEQNPYVCIVHDFVTRTEKQLKFSFRQSEKIACEKMGRVLDNLTETRILYTSVEGHPKPQY